MKILLITYYYKHKNAMASVRPTKLAKYLSRQGHSVTVLTSNQIDTWTKSYLEPVKDEVIEEYYAPEIKRWSLIRKYLADRKSRGAARLSAQSTQAKSEATAVSKRSFKARVKSYLSWLFYFNVAKQEDICMFRGMKREYLKNIDTHFDVVIPTYPTYGAFMMGMWLKKRGYCDKLVADFRDPLYNPGFRNKKAEARYDEQCLYRIVRASDGIVCVSQGIADGIVKQSPGFDKPISIITNGFDPDDVSESNVEVDFDKTKINFVYAGALYHGKRCVDMLAATLRELIDAGEIREDSFVFHYAGSDYPELIAQLDAFGLSKCAVDHGFVSRAESISMQKNATALLLLTWNETEYQGVVPGKLFEYMSIKTAPIIALITGDVAGSEVAQMIRKTGAGCAAEAAREEDMIALKEYVIKLFRGEASITSATDIYGYDNISKQYADFIKEI